MYICKYDFAITFSANTLGLAYKLSIVHTKISICKHKSSLMNSQVEMLQQI